jgi:Uncharacterized protein conserved in bacteria
VNYLLSVINDESVQLSDAEFQEMLARTGAINDEMKEQGVWVFAGGLRPPETATVVRARDGAVTTTDGPFVETKEHLAGFWVIEVADLDAALAWAEKATTACRAPIEVRPFDGLA